MGGRGRGGRTERERREQRLKVQDEDYWTEGGRRREGRELQRKG